MCVRGGGGGGGETVGGVREERVPQSQTAALPRHQEDEETDKTKQAQIQQTHEKHLGKLSLPQAR